MQGRVGRPAGKWSTRRERGAAAAESAAPSPRGGGNTGDAAAGVADALGDGHAARAGGTPGHSEEAMAAAQRALCAVAAQITLRAALSSEDGRMLQVGLAAARMADGWVATRLDFDGADGDEFEIFVSRAALEHRMAQRAAGLGDREPMPEPILQVTFVPPRDLTPALRAEQLALGPPQAERRRLPHPVVRRLDTMARPQPVALADVQRAAACLAALAAFYEVDGSGIPVWLEPPTRVPLRCVPGAPEATVREHQTGLYGSGDDEDDALTDAIAELQNFVDSDRRLLAERDAAGALYFGHLRALDDDMSDAAARFDEWFYHERVARGLGTTPVAAFCRRQRLAGRAGELARRLPESRVAALEVVETSPGVGLIARALPGDALVRLIDPRCAGVLRQGHLILGRLYADGRGAFHPSSARVTLGADARPAVLALLTRHGGAPSQRHLEPLLEDGDSPPPPEVSPEQLERRLRLAAKAAGLRLPLAAARARVAAAASPRAAGDALLEGVASADEEIRQELALLAAALWDGRQDARRPTRTPQRPT